MTISVFVPLNPKYSHTWNLDHNLASIVPVCLSLGHRITINTVDESTDLVWASTQDVAEWAYNAWTTLSRKPKFVLQIMDLPPWRTGISDGQEKEWGWSRPLNQTEEYSNRISTLIRVITTSDLVMSISYYTRKQVIALCHKHDVSIPSLIVLPISHPSFTDANKLQRDDTTLDWGITIPSVKKHDTFTIVMIGKWQKTKNHIDALHSVEAFVRKTGVSTRFVCIGDANDLGHMWETFDETVKDIPLEIVRTDSWIGERVKNDVLASAHAMLCPSTYEGFGVPPGEGLRFGLPVLAAHIEVTREVYGNLVDYADPRNTDQVAEWLLGVWEGKVTPRTGISSTIQKKYGLESYIHKVEEILEKLFS